MRNVKRGCLGLAVAACMAAPSQAAPVYTVIYTFLGYHQQPEDAAVPFCDLAADPQGNIYGTGESGGLHGGGAVFRLSPPAPGQAAWGEALLYSFGVHRHSPSFPVAGVTLDAQGNVYGTTDKNRYIPTGAIYKLDRAKNYAFKRLHKFDLGDAQDGLDPEASMIFGPGGLLYGTTSAGGPNHKGVIFSISPRASADDYTIIASFPGGRPAGGYPGNGALSLTPQGDLLATTLDIPLNAVVRHSKFPGHVFLFSKTAGAWKQQTLSSFPKRKGFYLPSYNVTQAPDGRLYGCAEGGQFGQGGVFALVPARNGEGRTQIPIYDFTNAAGQPSNVGNSICALTSDPSGNLFGVTSGGGQAGTGVFFELTRAGVRDDWFETNLHEFVKGDLPYGVPLRIGGSFYGVSAIGGDSGEGYVYQVTP